MPHSRLSKKRENQSKRQAYLFLAGIVLIIIFVIFLGVPILEFLTNTLSRNKGNDAAFTQKEFLGPPTLEVPTATNSSILIVAGRTSSEEGEIEIFVNSGLEDTITLDDTEFDTRISLRGENNVVKARLVRDGKKSEFSEDYHVRYVKDAPKLEISAPSDGAKFTKADQQIPISGATDPENTITVNGFVAIVNSDGHFTYNLNLSEGDNEVKIEARSPAGTSTIKTLKVNYSK